MMETALARASSTASSVLVKSCPLTMAVATSAENRRAAMITFADMKNRLNHLKAMAVSNPLVLTHVGTWTSKQKKTSREN